ncbi:MAG: hypothetical protein RL189_1718, partial [Pseudomonadota bacterium]
MVGGHFWNLGVKRESDFGGSRCCPEVLKWS